MKLTNNNNAFTLVELLVVVAIISALASILLPTLANSIEASRQIECANRMRQFMMAVHMYDGSFNIAPPPYMSDPNGPTDDHWSNMDDTVFHMLWRSGYIEQQTPFYDPYDKNTARLVNVERRNSSILLCPEGIFRGLASRDPYGANNCIGYNNQDGYEGVYFDNHTKDLLDEATHTSALRPMFVASYGVNAGVVRQNTLMYKYQYGFNYMNNWIVSPTPRFRQAPSKKLYAVEGGSRLCSIWLYKFKQRMTVPVDGLGSIAVRHGNMSNFSCYDGHVSSFSRDLLIQVESISDLDYSAKMAVTDKYFSW